MKSHRHASSRQQPARLFPTASRLLRAFCVAAGLATASVQPSPAHEFKLGAIEIGHPWSRATLPGAKVGAGYLILKNTGSVSDRLVSVTTDIAAKSEVHEMSMTDGVMSMRPLQDGVEIEAGAEARLEPRSSHIMFMGLTAPLAEGAKFSAVLTFEKAGSVTVEFAVEKAAGGESHSQHGG